jgi:hypothetical protein
MINRPPLDELSQSKAAKTFIVDGPGSFESLRTRVVVVKFESMLRKRESHQHAQLHLVGTRTAIGWQPPSMDGNRRGRF